MKVIFLCDISTGSDDSSQNWNPLRFAAMSTLLEYVYGWLEKEHMGKNTSVYSDVKLWKYQFKIMWKRPGFTINISKD